MNVKRRMSGEGYPRFSATLLRSCPDDSLEGLQAIRQKDPILMRTLSATVLLAVGSLSIASCGGGGETKYPLSGLQEYGVADDIAKELNEGGFECTDFQRRTASLNAASSGNCWHPDDSGKEIIVMVFNTDSDQKAQVGVYREMFSLINSGGFVEGGNWMVSCDDQSTCTAVASIMGGRTETASVLKFNSAPRP